MRITIYLLFCLILLSCGASQKVTNYSNKPYSEKINDAIFENFAAEPLSKKYGNVRAVKIIYVLKSAKMYYINNAFAIYHHDFTEKYFNNNQGLNVFNENNYSDNPNREYFLGNINYYPETKQYIFELSASDEMGIENIEKFYNLIVSSVETTRKISLMLNSNRLLDMKAELEKKMPVTDPSVLYKNLKYQAIANFEAEGRLIFVEDITKLTTPLKRTDIVVLKNTPLQIPILSGLIVNEFQTPLSHVSILGQNRKIPIFAYRNSFDNSELRKLEGQLIKLTVTDTNFIIKKIEFLSPTNNTRKRYLLKEPEFVDSLIDTKFIDIKSANIVGNKAAMFGELHFLSKQATFKIPESSFAIPFHYYQQHIEKSGAQALIQNLLAKLQTNPDADYTIDLQNIRNAIENFVVDPKIVAKINTRLQKSPYRTFRFRSSTNAEDAPGFSGAGLYDSKTVDLDSEKKTISRAMQKVWASLWNDYAFNERVYFNMDQTNCVMGILVHRSFPDEAVNGVAITKNLYRNDYPGFVINAQFGDVSVVSPENDIICDQFICYPEQTDEFYNNTVDVITYSDLFQSNLSGNKLTMSIDEIKNLASQLEKIKRYFSRKIKYYGTYASFGMDIEFKLSKDRRELYIKQARVFND